MCRLLHRRSSCQISQRLLSSDPLDSPAARKALNDAWRAIPREVRSQVNLPPQAQQPARQANLQPVVDQAIARFGGTAAIAYSDGRTVRVFGDDSARQAFSTVKVPIAIAALRDNPGNAPKVRAAITYSDSDAATSLRNSVPAGAVDRVIVEAGSRTAAPVTGWWGSTPWATSQQAKFVANLPCVDGSAPVLSMMGQVVAEQRWGIGRGAGVRFKSGWANSSDGWLIRQLGRIPTSRGDVAVAIMANPGSGGYGDALAMTNFLADGVTRNLAQIPAAACQ